jgi:4-hydroxybenzoate polyprenyltransferase
VRPAVSGAVSRPLALLEWGALAVLGVWVAWLVNGAVAAAAAVLWVLGVLYNVPPLRLKDWPYLDVLTESLNNGVRLAIGWLTILPDRVPPLSLLLSYWMSGAFLMAVKRFSEYRELADKGVAGAYRRSFQWYSEPRLLVSALFYAILGAQFGGMFILRYRLELVLMAPLIAGLFAYYLKIAYKPRSATQHPERLYREGALTAYLAVCLALFVALMFVHIPWLYEWFSVEPAGITPLWHLGR